MIATNGIGFEVIGSGPSILVYTSQAQFLYTTNSGTITITGYAGSGGAVFIPPTINGLPVTSIGNKALYGEIALTSVTIPNSVINVGYGAFANCTNLASVTIPDSVTSLVGSTVPGCLEVCLDPGLCLACLEPGVFEGCSSLSSIAIPGSVASVGSLAFATCTNLTNVTMASGVATIEKAAFYNCMSLSSAIIPDSVTSIGYGAFANCSSLASVMISNGVTSIGDYAFQGCFNLTGVTIPSSVTSIGEGPFAYCSSLAAITVDTNNPAYSSAIGVLFNLSQTTLIQYPAGRGGVPYTISNSVTGIGELAFAGCFSLTSLTIPPSVTGISELTFAGCSSLTSLTVPGSVTGIGEQAFAYCTGLSSVYFQGNAPSATQVNGFPMFAQDNNPTVYYLLGTTGWSSTFAGVPAVLWNPLGPSGGASIGVRSNQFEFNFMGPANLVVVVDACSNLANPVWVPLLTNALTNGSFYFSEPLQTNGPCRYYRITSP